MVSLKSGTRVVYVSCLQKHLFLPTCLIVQKNKEQVKELAKTAATAILTELHDKKKATNKYLSSSGSEYLWKHYNKERKTALLGTTTTNNQAESTLSGCASQIQQPTNGLGVIHLGFRA